MDELQIGIVQLEERGNKFLNLFIFYYTLPLLLRKPTMHNQQSFCIINNNKAYVAFDGAQHQEICKEDKITVQMSEKYVEIYTINNFGQFEKVDSKLKSR